jgi:Ca2+-binding EF-hand superfamily protein
MSIRGVKPPTKATRKTRSELTEE